MTRHRFINDGRSPIPMGASAEYACVCGRRGTRAAIELHIAETQAPEEPGAVDDDFGGGDTKAHYLPVTPREPAATSFGESDYITPPELPPLPPTRSILVPCPMCSDGVRLADLPEIAAWSCGHWIQKHPRSIAESFQDMLRIAYRAGAASAATGEIFELWYQREVL